MILALAYNEHDNAEIPETMDDEWQHDTFSSHGNEAEAESSDECERYDVAIDGYMGEREDERR